MNNQFSQVITIEKEVAKATFGPKKVLFAIIVLSGLGSLFSCSSRENSNDSEELNEAFNEDVAEIQSLDIKAKLTSGESFKLPDFAGCNYDNDAKALGLMVEAPSPRQQIQISEILKYSGLPANFILLKTVNKIENAFATTIDGQRIIVFDEYLLNMVDNKQSQEYWASMSILAHEIGHHLSGHTLDEIGSNHQSEMEADKFSGYVLFKMGARLEDATYAMGQIGSETDSPSHPSKSKRVEYIKEGWNEANQQRKMAALPPPPNDGYEDESIHYPPSQILDSSLYDALYIDKYYAYSLIEGNEGVILKRSKLDGGFNYEIILTSMAEDHEHLSIGEVHDFFMHHPFNAFDPLHHLPLGGFTEIVMMPGRKIRFTASAQGNRGNYILTEIETIPRID